MAEIKNVHDAAEAVAGFVPEKVTLSDGSVVFASRLHFLAWRSIFDELGRSFSAFIGGAGGGDLMDFPVAMLKLAAGSLIGRKEFTSEAFIAKQDEIGMGWDTRDIIRVARAAFKVNYAAEDVKELRDFFGDLGAVLNELLPAQSASPAQSAEGSATDPPPNRATRRRAAKLSTG